MQLAVIPPGPMLKYMLPQKIHLCLAHLVLTKPDYAEFYKNCNDYVILDNSAYEFNQSLEIELLNKALILIKPKEFVLPDVMEQADQTVKAVKTALHKLDFSDISFMAVPQGQTYDEWHKCLDDILALNDERIKVIGIPRIVDTWNRFRYPMIEMVPGWLDIHLLGWAGGDAAAVPIVLEKLYPGRIRSIDTTKPVNYALAERPIIDMFDKSIKSPTRPENYFELTWTPGGYLDRYVQRNSETLRRLVA